MADHSFLAWPFFEPRHRELADKLERWCAKLDEDEGDVDSQCRVLVGELGSAGFLKLCVADGDSRPDVRSFPRKLASTASFIRTNSSDQPHQ